MGQGESRLKRWFGKEHHPRRAALVRQTIRYQASADGVFALGALLYLNVHVVVGIPVMGLGLWLFGMSIRKLAMAFREPHSPSEGTFARPT